jgi:hypothetical protein
VRRSSLSVVSLGVFLSIAGSAARADEPIAVVRAAVVDKEGPRTRGAAFFVRVPEPAPADLVAAVVDARLVDPTLVLGAKEVEFRRGRSKRLAASATRLLVPPPPHTSDSDPAAGFLVFAVESPPSDVRVLDPETVPPAPGLAVRVLGIPTDGTEDEETLTAIVVDVSPEAIELDVEKKPFLLGWQGAPVVNADTGAVIGALARFRATKTGYRLTVTPIDRIMTGIDEPLEAGLGRAFASFAPAPAAPPAPPAGAEAPAAAPTSPPPAPQ